MKIEFAGPWLWNKFEGKFWAEFGLRLHDLRLGAKLNHVKDQSSKVQSMLFQLLFKVHPQI